LYLELNLSWKALGLFLHGAPLGFIDIGSKTSPIKTWFDPVKYAGRRPNVLASIFLSFSPASSFSTPSYEILLKNSITLHDLSVLIEALNKTKCATGKEVGFISFIFKLILQ
jgi:hypothetical protein